MIKDDDTKFTTPPVVFVLEEQIEDLKKQVKELQKEIEKLDAEKEMWRNTSYKAGKKIAKLETDLKTAKSEKL
jgi:predicted  nucleic acid-binding Zn-ribbon protein